MAQHRILRQVIALEGCPPGTDAALRAQLGDIVQRHLLPVLERAFDALDTPGQLLRAERLELQLGDVPLTGGASGRPVNEAWARAMAERLDERLAPALAEALQATDLRQADLELLAQFIERGTVPWWAALDQPDLVPAALQRLLTDGRAAQALRALGLADAGATAASNMAWQRLLQAARERERAAWLAALWGEAAALAQPWRGALADAVAAQGVAPARVQALWWPLVLPLAARQRAAGVDAADATHLRRLALALMAALALPAADVLPAWRRAFDRRLSGLAAGEGGAGSMAAWWLALDDPDGAAQAVRTADDGAASAARDWLRRQAAAAPAHGLAAQLFATLDHHWPRWPANARGAAEATLPGHAGWPDLGESAWRALAVLAQAALRSGHLPAAWRDALQAVAPRADATTTLAGAAASASQPGLALLFAALRAVETADPSAAAATAADGNEAAIDRGFAEIDRVAVADAGLVLLWPFLPAFFGRLGCLQTEGPQAGRAFVQPGGAARAALLLHQLAAGPLPAAPDGDDAGDDEPAPIAEHLLPLAKLLCGLAPEAPLPPAPLPDATALAEGEQLLQAAIAQAPILREMSVPAFRASFLWRAGQLSVQDGHWLLRVERAAYDMVRDRFPWSVAVVRLPWMDELLQVEW